MQIAKKKRICSGNGIEHRMEKRSPAKFDVEIYIEGEFKATVKAANISQSGIFVEAGQKLLSGIRVADLVFNRPYMKKISQAIRCMAVHRSEYGIGFIFFKTHTDKDLVTRFSEVA